MIIDGKAIAEKIYTECQAINCKNKFLAVLSQSPSPAVQSFIRQKQKAADRLGIKLREFEFSKELLKELVNDNACGGIVLQLPLGKDQETESAIAMLPPEKDVDNLTGKASVPAPAVALIERIMNEARPHSSGEIAIIGQGRLVGRPVAEWANKQGFSKVGVYDKGFNPNDLVSADTVVSGAGVAHLFSASQLKKGAIVIDFGYSKSADGGLKGDFKPTDADLPLQAGEHGIMYTPTPGGTGPILVACLMRNFCVLNKKND